MTQKEFNERKEKYARECAEICRISFQEYEWDKLIQILDYSTHFDSIRNKYELYKNNQIITPYLDETGNYKLFQGKHNIMLFQSEKWNSNNDFPIFHQECQKDISTRWNIWEFVLYPSGEYESSFIWDNEAYLEEGISTIKNSLAWFYVASINKIYDEFLPEEEWETATLIMQFKEGKIQPLEMRIPFEGEILNFTFNIETIEEAIYGVPNPMFIEQYEKMYKDAHQEDIKDSFFGDWTKVTMNLIPDKQNNWENYIFE